VRDANRRAHHRVASRGEERGEWPLVSPFRQPKAVWAVAFACRVSFMGIGLVDPILVVHESPTVW
jgi:hypothetical protein